MADGVEDIVDDTEMTEENVEGEYSEEDGEREIVELVSMVELKSIYEELISTELLDSSKNVDEDVGDTSLELMSIDEEIIS